MLIYASDWYEKGAAGVSDEQLERFHVLKELAAEAQSAVEQICALTKDGLQAVDFDNPDQGNQLQRVQECAGKAVSALEKLNVTAKHARSWGAQQHIEQHH